MAMLKGKNGGLICGAQKGSLMYNHDQRVDQQVRQAERASEASSSNSNCDNTKDSSRGTGGAWASGMSSAT